MGRETVIAENLLTVAAAALASAPPRQIVTIGAPTDPLAQSDQLAVGWLRNFRGVPGQPDPTPQYNYTETCAEYVVRLVRCFPSSRTEADTDPSVVTAVSTALLDEVSLMRVALYAWRPPGESEASEERWVGDVTAIRPSGLVVAAQVVVQASL